MLEQHEHAGTSLQERLCCTGPHGKVISTALGKRMLSIFEWDVCVHQHKCWMTKVLTRDKTKLDSSTHVI